MKNQTKEESNQFNGSAADFRNKVQASGQQLEKAVETAGQRVGTIASDLAHSTSDSMKASQEYVKENPVKGVAIAAATGLVVGSLLTMALRRPRS